MADASLLKLLKDTRAALESLPQDVLGHVPDTATVQGWWIRDELIHNISAQIRRLAAAPKPDDELARLERKAIDYMIDDWYEHYSTYRDDGWVDSTKHISAGFITAMRIIELKGRLERHPEHPEWVRVKEGAL